MKRILEGVLIFCIFLLIENKSLAQTKKINKKVVTHSTNTVKRVERGYGLPIAINEISDITESSYAYPAVKNLIENYGVLITFDDKTFRGKEALLRGDFIVSLNSAYNSIRKAIKTAAVDTSLINTYDRNRSYITSVNEIKDLKPGSVYYSAVQSLIERWGVAAPFTKAKLLNASASVPESEVYDILKATLGYKSAGNNSFNSAMSREKFAIVLNNALTQKIYIINSLGAEQKTREEAESKRIQDSLTQVDNIRRAAIAKQIEAKKEDAQKREEEARKKLKDKEK